MKFIYKHLEMIIVLCITFALFVSLVIFYEGKLSERNKIIKNIELNSVEYYKTNDGYYNVTVVYLETIAPSYIRVLDSYNEEHILNVDLDKYLISYEQGNKYVIKVKDTTDTMYSTGELYSLLKQNVIEEIKYDN